jgi:hypothetical protein
MTLSFVASLRNKGPLLSRTKPKRGVVFCRKTRKNSYMLRNTETLQIEPLARALDATIEFTNLIWSVSALRNGVSRAA